MIRNKIFLFDSGKRQRSRDLRGYWLVKLGIFQTQGGTTSHSKFPGATQENDVLRVFQTRHVYLARGKMLLEDTNIWWTLFTGDSTKSLHCSEGSLLNSEIKLEGNTFIVMNWFEFLLFFLESLLVWILVNSACWPDWVDFGTCLYGFCSLRFIR